MEDAQNDIEASWSLINVHMKQTKTNELMQTLLTIFEDANETWLMKIQGATLSRKDLLSLRDTALCCKDLTSLWELALCYGQGLTLMTILMFWKTTPILSEYWDGHKARF